MDSSTLVVIILIVVIAASFTIPALVNWLIQRPVAEIESTDTLLERLEKQLRDDPV